MRNNYFRGVPLVVLATVLISLSLPVGMAQGNHPDEQKYAGTWTGSYLTKDGGSEKLSYVFSKDEKGQWRGTVRFTNQNGEQSAEFKSLQIVDGKMRGKIEDPNGEVEVTLEGQFQGEKFEGTYSVSPKGSTEVVESGTWKVTKGAAAK